jgi:hypothetical protein
MLKACFSMLQTQNAFVIHIEKYVFSASNLPLKKPLLLKGLTLS